MKYNFRFYLLLAVMLLAASVEGLAQAGGKSAPQAQGRSTPQADMKPAPQADSKPATIEPASPFPRIAYDERAWKPFEPAGGNFTIAFPGKPGAHTETVQVALGPLVNQVYGLDIGVCLFAVSYSDIPIAVPADDKELINRALDAGRDRALAGSGGKLISESRITLDGYLGRFVLYSDKTGLIHSQSYHVGNRLYQVLVITDDYRESPAEDQRFFKDLVNRFFTSFALTRKAN